MARKGKRANKAGDAHKASDASASVAVDQPEGAASDDEGHVRRRASKPQKTDGSKWKVPEILKNVPSDCIPNWGSNGICTTTPLVRARLIRPGEPFSRSTRSRKRGPPTLEPVTVTPEPSHGVSATLRPYEAPAEQQIGTTGYPSLATPSCMFSVTGASSSPESAHHRVCDSPRAYNFPNVGMFADTRDARTTIPASTPIPPYLYHQVHPPPGFPPIAIQFNNVDGGTMPPHLLWPHAICHSTIGMEFITAAQIPAAQPSPGHQHARAYVPSVMPAYNPGTNYPTFANGRILPQAPDESQLGLALPVGHAYHHGKRRDNHAAAASYGSSRRYSPYYHAPAGRSMPRDTQSIAALAYLGPPGPPVAIAPFPQTEERSIANRSDIASLPSHVPTNIDGICWNYPWQDDTAGQTAPCATPMDASQAAVHVQSHSGSWPSSAHIPGRADESRLGLGILGGDNTNGGIAGTPSDELVAYHTPRIIATHYSYPIAEELQYTYV